MSILQTLFGLSILTSLLAISFSVLLPSNNFGGIELFYPNFLFHLTGILI